MWAWTDNENRETFRIKTAENKLKTALCVFYAYFTDILRLFYDSVSSPTPRTFQG